jgi:sugar phosphate isomerase/epimerase
MAHRLTHTHLHDNDGAADRHWPLGQGTVKSEPTFAAILRHAPQVTLALEVTAGMEIKLAGLRRLHACFARGRHPSRSPGAGREGAGSDPHVPAYRRNRSI